MANVFFKLRSNLHVIDGIEINRWEFDAKFAKTREKASFSFNGWDGKSYDGESRSAYVYRTNIEGFEDLRFVKVGKAIHLVDEDDMVLEKSAGKMNHAVDWLVDVKRA